MLTKAKLFIVANIYKPAAVNLANETYKILLESGHEVKMSFSLDEDYSNLKVDLIIVFGGDGTVLNVVRRLKGGSTPILPVNLGRLGYLASIAPENAVTAINEALAGRLKITTRMMLEAMVLLHGQLIWQGYALNEFVLSTYHTGRMMPVEVYIDNEEVMVIRGDGLIVATPTGSTAYALSAGGPVVSPELNAMVIVAICPHQLANRPLVIAPHETVNLKYIGTEIESLDADGQTCVKLEPGAEVIIKPATRVCKIYTIMNHGYTTLREKLSWGWREDSL